MYSLSYLLAQNSSLSRFLLCSLVVKKKKKHRTRAEKGLARGSVLLR